MLGRNRLPAALVIGILLLGLVAGIVISIRVDVDEPAGADERQVTRAAELEEAFIAVVRSVGPAVVSISTEQTEIIRYRSPFRDEFFDQFFREFFDIPGGGTRKYKHYGLGSGVIIDDEGYILTNHHVVEEVDRMTVTLSDGRKFPAEVRGVDPRSDLAVIKIKADGLTAAELGDSDEISVGQWAIALGNPFGFATGHSPEPSVSVGVVSALHRSLGVSTEVRDYSDLIQTDAAINPGNSGGPLVDIGGRIIGINVAIYTRSGGYQGVSFAIPVNTARAIIGRLIEGKKVLYGWLGVKIQDLDAELAPEFGLPDAGGAVVIDVLPDSPAEKAGLKKGDVIRRFDGKEIKNITELLKAVSRIEVGKKVKAGIIRSKKKMNVEVEIGERPSEIEEFTEIAAGTWRGLEVREITPEAAREYGLDRRTGVVISGVEPGSPADSVGLQAGMVIDEINQKAIRNTGDYQQITAEIEGNALVRTDRGYFVVKPETEN
jgi:serine protease Do